MAMMNAIPQTLISMEVAWGPEPGKFYPFLALSDPGIM
jgi:hypothetical protein